jgi:chemotaxis signal transduction protein
MTAIKLDFMKDLRIEFSHDLEDFVINHANVTTMDCGGETDIADLIIKSLHNLKGNAQAVGYPSIVKMLHTMEDDIIAYRSAFNRDSSKVSLKPYLDFIFNTLTAVHLKLKEHDHETDFSYNEWIPAREGALQGTTTSTRQLPSTSEEPKAAHTCSVKDDGTDRGSDAHAPSGRPEHPTAECESKSGCSDLSSCVGLHLFEEADGEPAATEQPSKNVSNTLTALAEDKRPQSHVAISPAASLQSSQSSDTVKTTVPHEIYATQEQASLNKIEEDLSVTEKRAGTEKRRFLLCSYDSQQYALSATYIKEVIDRRPIHPLPMNRPGIEGLIILRGAPLAIVDLKEILGHRETDKGCVVVCEVGEHSFGIEFDSASQVLTLDQTDLHDTALPPTDTVSSCIESIATLHQKTVLFLNLEKLFHQRIPGIRDQK